MATSVSLEHAWKRAGEIHAAAECRRSVLSPALLSSKSNEWATPQWLFDELNKEFNFDLDPCSTHDNAKCLKHFTLEDDGLSKSWRGHNVFMNPPYGRQIGLWVRKAYEESTLGATVVCLVPARTDTKWWHEYAALGEVRFLRGRVKFGGSKHGAPFPSAVVIFKRST